MAIVTRYGNAVKAPTAINPAPAVDAEAQVRSAYSNIPVNLDSITSIHVLARLPSNARIIPTSVLYFSALAGLTSYDVGLGVNGAVIAGKNAVFIAAQTLAVAGNLSLQAALAAGNIGKKLWELAGYASDPGGMIDVIGTVNAAATGTGTIESFIMFAKG